MDAYDENNDLGILINYAYLGTLSILWRRLISVTYGKYPNTTTISGRLHHNRQPFISCGCVIIEIDCVYGGLTEVRLEQCAALREQAEALRSAGACPWRPGRPCPDDRQRHKNSFEKGHPERSVHSVHGANRLARPESGCVACTCCCDIPARITIIR